MEWVETTGRTLDAALDAALDELGVDDSEVEYEVLSEPRGGLLGRFGGEARIRARVKPISREKPGDRQRRNRRTSKSRDGRRPERPADPTKDGELAPASRGAGVGGNSGTAGSNGGTARRRRGGRSRPSASGGNGGESPRDARHDQDEVTTVDAPELEISVEEQARIAEEFARGVVRAFDLGGDVHSVLDEDAIVVEIEGENLGLLVGPRGATLTAIEELVRTVVQRQTDGHGARIFVDVAGYRAKRRAALEDFTRSLVERVLETGTPQRLEPMSSSDRKVVHDVAATIPGVLTESEGEDPRRRVVLRKA